MSPRNDDGKSGKKTGPAWRGNRAAAGKVKAAPDWRKFKPKEGGEELKYRFKRTLLWLACAVLIVAFVLYNIAPQNTPFKEFRATAYPLQFPPLALAKEDEEFFKTVSPSNLRVETPVPFRFYSSTSNLADDDGTPQRFLTQLSQVKPSGPGWFGRNNAVIIYIAAHGLVNEKGEACLVPPNSDAFSTEKWLPLQDFLQQICKLDNLRGVRKLVVLDCNRISIHWRSGVMDNRFADQLPRVIRNVGDPKLYVLNSTSPGQVAWAAPELRGSVFGHFLGRGLRGEASLQFPNDRSRYTVSLVELRDYLAANVDHYVRERRGARQVPVLYGPNGEPLSPKEDVPIVAADWWLLWRSPDPPRPAYDVLAQAKNLMEPEGQKSSSLQQAWEVYQRRAAAQMDDRTSELPAAWRRGYVMDPVRWASIEQRLLALEERLFAGEEYQATLAQEFDKIAAELSADDWQTFPETQSVTNLALQRWQSLAAAANRPTEDEKPATDLALMYENWLQAAPDVQPRITFPDRERPRALRDLLRRFGLDRDFDPDSSFEKFNYDRLRSVLKFARLPADAPPSADERPLIEAHFLKLLSSGSSPAAERLLPEVVRTRSLAERAATPLDVRTHYALELLVNQADAERRLGEDAFFMGDQASLVGIGGSDEFDPRRSAEQRLARARGFSDPQSDRIWEEDHTGYLAAVRWGDRLGDMFLLRDEIWATIPHVAEWYFRRGRLELAAQSQSPQTFRQHIATLTEVLDLSVSFSEELERLIDKRDREQDLRQALADLSVRYTTLQARWDAVRSMATDDAKIRSKAEIRFQPGDEVRRIEQVMHTPLYHGARVQDLLSKYLLTLEEWSRDMPQPLGASDSRRSAAASAESGAGAKAMDETEFLDGYREFLARYHRVLAHEFRKPYEKDLEVLRLAPEHRLEIDHELRRNPAAWGKLRGLLGDYNQALAKNPVSVSSSTRANQARDELSVWDRRIRVSAYWLGCFNRELNAPALGIPTPAAWLREVDHWHLTCWHAYRLLQDFWGNGLPNDKNRQFFDLAAEHCWQVTQSKDLPFQYDVPGGKVENLEDLHAARNVAHAAGLEVQIRSVQTPDPAPPDGVEFQATTTQKIESPDRKPADLPAGQAGFYLSRAGSVQQLDDTLVEYLGKRMLRRAPVEILERLSNQPGERPVTGKIQAARFEAPPVALEARVWYRGHVWSHPFEPYHEVPKTGIKFVYRREPVSAPTVQVSGDDAPSGAIVFVFDCSSSMMNPDGRFAAAHDALSSIVADLKKNAAGLKIGLIAYGHRTPHRPDYFPPPFDKMYWKATQRWNDPDPLTADGKALGDAIKKFPHPDLDIETLLPPKAGWEAEIDAKLGTLSIDRCFGVTPLYAAITQALREVNAVQGVESRQVIVLSDGVNIPNACDLSLDTLLQKGKEQNAEDLDTLKKTLERSSKVNVRVVLFGGVKPGLEARQLAALQEVGQAPQFVVDPVPDIKSIKKSIEAAFAKPDFEIVAADRDRPATGRQPFNSIWTYPQWPSSGDLIGLQQHQVIVRGPRLSSPLIGQLLLGGGEALRIDYQAANSTLEFLPDILDPFYSAPLEKRGDYRGPDLPVMLEAIKPVVGPQSGDTRPTTFRVRMGSNSNRRFIPWPRHVWAEIRPLNPPEKYKDLNFQIADLKFEDKTRTPILHLPVPSWPIAVEGAQIDVWLRYGSPAQYPRTTISPADDQPLPPLPGKNYGLDGVEFVVQQQLVEGTSRKITVTERHPADTPLSRLYRTRVQLSPPPDVVERLYVPPSSTSSTSEVVHTFHYTTPVHLNANLSLEINTAEQIKDGSLRATLQIEGWNR